MRPRWRLIAVISILLLAAYLRMYKIDQYMTFLGDEGRDVLVVKRMIVDHKFTLLGPTASVGGFFLGPIYYYLMLPFLWAWGLDPVGPAVMVAFFGVATVYLLYRFGRIWFNEQTGFIAASLYAVSPLVIAYSRSSWNPNVVPFFALLFVWFLWKTTHDSSMRGAFFAGFCLGIGLQLHYLFLFHFVLGAFFLLLYRRKVSLTHILLLVSGFLVGFSPFLAFEIRHGFGNSRSIVQFLMAGKDTGFVLTNYLSTVLDVTNRIFGRLILRLPGVELWEKLPTWYVLSIRFLSVVGGAITMGVLAKLALSRKNVKAPSPVMLLAMWAIVPIALFGLYKKAIYDYYFGIVFPVPFLAVGFVFSLAWKHTWTRRIAMLLWFALLVFNWQGRPFLYAPNNQLSQMRKIAATAFAQTEGKPFNFALLADGNSDHAYRYFFEVWGNPPVTIENVQNDPDRRTVTDQLIVICETLDCQPLGNSLWEIAGFGRSEITGMWEVPFVKIYRLVRYTGV